MSVRAITYLSYLYSEERLFTSMERHKEFHFILAGISALSKNQS